MTSSFIDQLPEWLQTYDPNILIGAAAFLIVMVTLLSIMLMIKVRKKTKIPTLHLIAFQIAPMGRDAFLKLNNPGDRLTLLTLKILGRPDIIINNQVTGHILIKDANYNVLMESSGLLPIEEGLQVVITFSDVNQQTYLQHFSLDTLESISLGKTKN